jgi:hypothetical protein
LNKKTRAVLIAFILLYAGATLFTTLHHEPWRDEAQAWLIARDLDLPGLFNIAGYEGHPVLWNLLLMPLAKSGLPILSQQLLNWGISIAAISILFFYSPFPLITKIALSFSFLLGYEYAVISRNYMLCVLLLFSIATFYRRRFEKPLLYGGLVFLLFNTNVFSFLWGISFSVLYLYEIRKKTHPGASGAKRPLAGFAIMGLGGLAAFLQLLPHEDNFLKGFFPAFFGGLYPEYISQVIMPGFPASPGVLVWPALIILALIFISFKNRLVLLNALAGTSWVLYIFTFKYAGVFRHMGLIFAYVIFNLWLAYQYDKEKGTAAPRLRKAMSYALAPLLVFSIFGAAQAHYADYKYAFSTSKQIAGFLEQNKLLGETIITFRSPHGSAILPYLPGKKFIFGETGAYGTYLTWNKTYGYGSGISIYRLVDEVSAAFPDRSHVLLLLTFPLPPDLAGRFALLYQTEGGFYLGRDEVFYLYKPLY